MSKKCKIVQDLLPNYLENVTTEETNEYIREHIAECKECYEVYSAMKQDLKVCQIDEKENIDFFKKYHNKVFILKIITIVLILIIAFGWGFKGIQYTYKYQRGKYALDIIEKVCENITNFEKQNNFILSIDDGINAKTTYYYKDGRFKEESEYHSGARGCTLKYGEDEADDMNIIFCYPDIKMANSALYEEINSKEYIFSNGGSYRNTFRYLADLKQIDTVELSKFNITEEIEDGRLCYYFEGVIGDTGYVFVVDKESMLLKSYASSTGSGGSTRYKYEYEIGTVTDEYVKPENIEEYEMDKRSKDIVKILLAP